MRLGFSAVAKLAAADIERKFAPMWPITLLDEISDIQVANRSRRIESASRTAPNFTPLEFLDVRERGLSRILAWLLNPRGSHEQGAAFLEEFTRWLELDDEWRRDLDNARVILEAPTIAITRVGYLDVLVRLKGRMLAIENKPTATDQPEQVRRYLADLSSRRLDAHCLVYLSGTGSAPSDESIGADEFGAAVAVGTLRVRGYAAIADWMDVCAPRCVAPTVSAMLAGIKSYVLKEFSGVTDQGEVEEIGNALLSSRERLEAGLALLEAETSIKERLLATFVLKVEELVRGRRGWRVRRSDIGSSNNSGLVIGLTPDATVGFGIQFDKSGHRFLFYGVNSVDGRALPRGAKRVIQELVGVKTGTAAWPVWKQVGPNDKFFPMPKATGREFWLGLNDGSVARMLVSYVEEVERTLRGAKLLTAVKTRVLIK
ncbi:PD-(D/E)XK nuclease family protein [Sphingomonas faeni]|uniref:PDDEXK-like family protein n=1 Tax=Sphingomonas faeni TaxID=185950 RepID=UPI00335B7F9A